MADEDKNKVRLYANPGVDAFVSSSTTATIVFGASVEPIGKPPDDHEIYQLVGRVTSDWAHIEHTLDAIIWELAGLDPQTGACITAQLMGHGPRCLTITALATRLGLSEILPKVEKVKNHLFTISDERNRCVHDPWLVYAKTERTAQFRPRSN